MQVAWLCLGLNMAGPFASRSQLIVPPEGGRLVDLWNP